MKRHKLNINEIIRLYKEEKLSQGKIANIMKVSQWLIRDILIKNDVKLRKFYVSISKDKLEELYSEKLMTQREIGEMYGVSGRCISLKLQKYNIPRIWGHRPNKNGRISNHGYVMVYKPNHPNNDRNFVLEHRLIIEENLGRFLSSDEHVHHIDGVRTNNDLKNLYLTDRNSHPNIHKELTKVAYKLVQSGIIKFKDGKYFI